VGDFEAVQPERPAGHCIAGFVTVCRIWVGAKPLPVAERPIDLTDRIGQLETWAVIRQKEKR